MRRKKLLGLFLTVFALVVCTVGLSVSALAATEEVEYLYYASEADAIAGRSTPGSQTCTVVESGTTTMSNGWYVVNAENVGITSRITVSGEVNLILKDDCKLTASKGIEVAKDNTLNIYAQSGGTGALTATGGTYNAGIGGGNHSAGGTVTVHGGMVTANGGTTGAGIGGGNYSAGGAVTIYGGTQAAGIGGGYNGAGGSVTIHGGMVTANGGITCAGIGGGRSSADDGTLTLGADVTLYGDTTENPTTVRASEAGEYTGDRFLYMRTEYTPPAPVYTVTLTGGANATPSGGATTQTGLTGAMETVTFTPDAGYHFDSFVAITGNGVTAEFDEGSVVVSGTPTGDVEFAIPDAEANAVPFVPTFRTQSLVLSGQIGVNFFMDLSGLTPEQREASYVEFTVSGKGSTTTRDNFDAGHTSKNGLYYGFTCYVNSIQMADTITAVYHYSDGGEQTVEKEYSVKAYLDAIQGLTQNEKMRSLAVAMGDYGYYAQQYLSQLRHFTLDVDYTAMPEGTEYTEDIITAATDAVDGYTVNYDLDGTGIEKLSYSLLLDSSTGIYIYLTPSAGYTGEVAATVGDGEENVAELQSDGRYRVHIANISTHRLGETYTVTVTTENGTFGITLSALSYARTMLNYGGGTAKEQRDNAMVSLYRFYDSAMDYAGRAH